MDKLTLAMIATLQPLRAIHYVLPGDESAFVGHAKCLLHPVWGPMRVPGEPASSGKDVRICPICASETEKLEWEDTWTG